MRTLISLTAAAGAITTARVAYGQAQPAPYEYGPGMMWSMGYGMFFGPFFMILALAAVIVIVVLVVRWIGGPWHGPTWPHQFSPTRTPLDILKERFARGEINKEEFEERRRVLGD